MALIEGRSSVPNNTQNKFVLSSKQFDASRRNRVSMIEARQKRSIMSDVRIPNAFTLIGTLLLAGMVVHSGSAVTAFSSKSASIYCRRHLTKSPLSETSFIIQSTKRRTKISQRTVIALSMTEKPPDEDLKGDEEEKPKRKKIVEGISNTTSMESELLARITKLESLVSKHEVDLLRLRREVDVLGEAAIAFARLTQLLQKAGLADAFDQDDSEVPKTKPPKTNDAKVLKAEKEKTNSAKDPEKPTKTLEYFDDSEIFGTAPASVIDAADAAGAAILACMLGGKQRMLVDVRDAELSRDPEILVQFVELAILPVAAGLEGLPKKTRNRVKIVFPTVSQLLQYRRLMSLSAPDVVALSTLGFDPVEKQDNLVVILAPAPDDDEGMDAMNELLAPTDPNANPLRQPVVVINHHMLPLSGPAKNFEVAYHLRLLSVQYMSGDEDGDAPEYLQGLLDQRTRSNESLTTMQEDHVLMSKEEEDTELEAAMKHAREIGMNHGVTRAMVIRAYPKPWHVFVDTSPDTDADFEVAATFDEEPTQDDVNFAIVECLEGSESEDELVAFQMQQALEAGQLDKVSEMLGIVSDVEIDNADQSVRRDESGPSNLDDDDKNFYEDFDPFPEDSC